MRFNNPLEPDQLARALDRMSLGSGARLVDVGCGRGELLAMALARFPATGLGVDPDEDAIRAAGARLAFAGGRVTLLAERAEDVDWSDKAFEAAFCVGSTHAFGEPGEALGRALDALDRWVVPGGYVLVGEGYWRRPPPEPYLRATGMGEADYRAHEENAREGTARGWELLLEQTSSLASWDRFERTFWDAAEARLAGDPDDPEAVEHADHWRRWREAYERWGRDTLGFGLYLWRV